MTEICPKQALAALDRALSHDPAGTYSDLVDAARAIAVIRDGLIQRRRQGSTATGVLDRVNAALSLVIGCEYPLAGVRRERIEQARQALVEAFAQP
jgi:hypothetical protein